MSNITENVRGILATLVEQNYIKEVVYQRDAKANVELKGRKMPVCELRSVSSYQYNLTQNMVYETARCNLLFLEKQPKLDYDEAENDLLVNCMEWAARQFIIRAMNHDEIAIQEDSINVETVFDRYDVNTTGVNIQCTIVVKTPTCLATYKHNPILVWMWDDGRTILFDDAYPVGYGNISGIIIRDPVLADDRDTLLWGDGQRITTDNVDQEEIIHQTL